jgi:hypothetical protein
MTGTIFSLNLNPEEALQIFMQIEKNDNKNIFNDQKALQ